MRVCVFVCDVCMHVCVFVCECVVHTSEAKSAAAFNVCVYNGYVCMHAYNVHVMYACMFVCVCVCVCVCVY
jgi:hypothetical protein